MPYLLRAFCVFVLLAAGSPAHALDPTLRLSQYGHTAWRLQDGVFNGQPESIAQTTDGYLWIGTHDGLVRFDGVRFTPWTPTDGTSLPGSHITSLLADADGGLWIGAGGGVAHWSNGKLETFPAIRGRILGIERDSAGNVWVVRSRQPKNEGPLCRISSDGSHCFDPGDGHPCRFASVIAIDADDAVWIGGTGGLCRFRDGRFSTVLHDATTPASQLVGISGMAVDPKGALWIGTPRDGNLAGLRRVENESLAKIEVQGFDTRLAVVSVMLDSHDALWVATLEHGIYRISNGKARHFASADGLTSNTVNVVFEDREGSIWVATSKGLDRFRATHVASYSMREGLASDYADSVLAARDGSVWIGNPNALNVIRDGTVSKFDQTSGLPGWGITSLLEDHAGRIWVGVDQDMMIHTDQGFSQVATYDGKPAGLVTALAEDPAGNVWGVENRAGIAKFSGNKLVERIPLSKVAIDLAPDGSGGLWIGLIDGLGRYRNGKFEEFAPAKGVGAVSTVRMDADGSLWGVAGKGLLHVKDDQVHILGMRNGLPCEKVLAFVKDDEGSMWLGMRCGYVRIRASELDRWSRHPEATIRTRLFDAVDGALPGYSDFTPRASKGLDGRLWFTNASLLQSIDPAHLDENGIVPPVHIEAFTADRKDYPASGHVRVPPLTDDIKIDYTALSLVAPQHVMFRYRLEGHDADWQDVGTRREAFYSGLGPGDYRFRVVASNNDGLWNEDGATLEFSIPPAWYQTLWFRASVILVLIGMAIGLHWLRLRSVAHSMGMRFDERLAERTRIARELHDTLLQGVQGLLLNIHVAAKKPEAESKQMLERALLTADRVIIEGRNRVSSLRVEHLTDDELVASIETVAHELSPTADVGFQVVRIGTTSALHAPVADEVFYIAREALTNAYRHARATQIRVELRYGLRHFVMTCEDDGCGFDASLPEKSGHWGLGGMAERAARFGGAFECRTAPGKGTTIRVRIPSYRAYSRSSRLLFHLRGVFARTNAG